MKEKPQPTGATLDDILDVPEVNQLPELSPNGEKVIAFADMVLTNLLAYDAALLHATKARTQEWVSWRIKPRDGALATHDVEAAVSPDVGIFRSVLARFGSHYMDGQIYNGYALRWLRQRGRVHRCLIYMSNFSQSGYWIQIHAAKI